MVVLKDGDPIKCIVSAKIVSLGYGKYVQIVVDGLWLSQNYSVFLVPTTLAGAPTTIA